MYQQEINQLRIAIEALDALLEGTGNVYSSTESIRLDNEQLKGALDALLFARQNLIGQIKILEVAQIKSRDLALTMEQ